MPEPEGLQLYEDLARTANDLLRSPTGQQLQAYLYVTCRRAAFASIDAAFDSENRARTHDHWLQHWWNSEGYLKPRIPLPINVNCAPVSPPFVGARSLAFVCADYFAFDNDPNNRSMTARAASLTYGFLSVRHELQTQTLPPEFRGERPLCMSKHIFFLKKKNMLIFVLPRPIELRFRYLSHSYRSRR